MGIVYQNYARSDGAGTGYTLDVSYAILRRGQYVLYVHCNNQVYAEKFNAE